MRLAGSAVRRFGGSAVLAVRRFGGSMLGTMEDTTMGTIKKLAKKGRKTARKAYDKLETKLMAAAYKRALRRKVKELGAVSREVALAMAEGVLSLFRADLAIAVTGVAGPGGGSRGKPVGTVWVAVVATGGVRYAHRFRFPGGREAVRRETVRASLGAAIGVLRSKAAGGK